MPRKKRSEYVKPDYHANNNKKRQTDNESKKKQKVKLRTSLDIYNRLMHDTTLNIDLSNVRIGYVDKMGRKIVEVEVSKWRMISMGGDIPLHCIMYFVLTLSNGQTLKIWDRETRLDRLYCSGNTVKEQSLRCILKSMQNQQPIVETSVKKQQKPAKHERIKRKAVCNVMQRFKYLVVLDFEATCEKNVRITPQEIIEWPAMIIDTATFKILHSKTFHYYIKPEHNPKLSSFCTELTGITQAMIDINGSQNTIESVVAAWNKWCFDNDLLPKSKNEPNACVVTCGDWDLKSMWSQQRKLSKCSDAALFHSWINIKSIFKQNETKIEGRGSIGKRVGGMMAMLNFLNIEHEGQHHSGIDDVKNICKIVQHLLMKGIRFNYTTRDFGERSILDDIGIKEAKISQEEEEKENDASISIIDLIDECISTLQHAIGQAQE